MGLDPMTPRSRPKLKPRVRRLTDYATQPPPPYLLLVILPNYLEMYCFVLQTSFPSCCGHREPDGDSYNDQIKNRFTWSMVFKYISAMGLIFLLTHYLSIFIVKIQIYIKLCCSVSVSDPHNSKKSSHHLEFMSLSGGKHNNPVTPIALSD